MNLLKKGTLLFAGFLFLLQCSSYLDGNGSGVGTGKITGMVNGKLFQPDGATPAQGAVVEVRCKNRTAVIAAGGKGETAVAVNKTVTDQNGVFSFDTIDSGLYIIEGSDGLGNMVLFDSVIIMAPAETLTLPPASLEPAGAIQGTVSLSNGGNPLQVFILAFGVDRFSQVRADGNFLFSGLAAGTYTFKILSLDPQYGSIDTAGVVVRSGDTISLGTVVLPLRMQGAPVLRVHYDLYQMQATLTWNVTAGSNVKGYNIYRFPRTVEDADSEASMSLPLNRLLLNDTMFVDSFKNYSNEPEFAENDLFLEPGMHFQYRVSMIDMTGNEGPLSNEVAVTLSSVLESYDSIQLESFPVGGERGSLMFNNNGEFTLLFNKSDDTAGSIFDVYRYSGDGNKLSSWRFPESLAGDYWVHIVNSNTTTGNCYFSVVTEEGTILYTVLPTGVFIDTIAIAERSKLSVVNNNAFFYLNIVQADAHIIKRVDLQTGTMTKWREYPGCIVEALCPLSNGGIGVELSSLDSGISRKKFICLNSDGTERCSFPLQNGILVAANDSLFVFSDYWYFICSHGTILKYKNTSLLYRGSLMMGLNGTVYTVVYDSPGKILLSRFPDDSSDRCMSGVDQYAGRL